MITVEIHSPSDKQNNFPRFLPSTYPPLTLFLPPSCFSPLLRQGENKKRVGGKREIEQNRHRFFISFGSEKDKTSLDSCFIPNLLRILRYVIYVTQKV